MSEQDMNDPITAGDDDITGYEGGGTGYDEWDDDDDVGDVCPLCDIELDEPISAFHHECYFDLGLCPYCNFDLNDQSED